MADLFLCGPGCGTLFRPSPTPFRRRTSARAARRPTGASIPDLTAHGVWVWAQGTCKGARPASRAPGSAPLNFVSGTSFSAPTASGAAALLRRAAAGRRRGEVRNALVRGADPPCWRDDSSASTRGADS